MNPDELKAKIEELELISLYGEPVEAAKAAQELAKLKSSALYEQYLADVVYDVDEGYPFQSTQFGSDDALKSRIQVHGRTHSSLNIFDALRTMGFSEAEIKTYCKENRMKYEAPPRSTGRMRVN